MELIADAGDVSGAQSVERATSLLMMVARHRDGGANLGDLVAESGLKQPTVRRLLLALMRTGLIEQDPGTRRYFLGSSCYILGTLAADRFGIHRVSVESLIRIAEYSQDTAFVTLRSGTYGVCLHRQEGAYPIRSHVLAAGDRHPLMVSAGNLAILASLEDPEVDFIIQTHAQSSRAKYPNLTVAAVREVLAEARARGFAVNRGLTFPGSWGMGAVIRDINKKPIAALSIGAIEERLGERRQKELAAVLFKEVREIEAQLHSMLSLGTGPAHSVRKRGGDQVERRERMRIR